MTLPDGWEQGTLGAVADVLRGVTYKRDQAVSSPIPGYVPLVRATNILDGHLVLDEGLVYVPTTLVKAEQLLKAGDVVLATSSGSLTAVGRSAWVPEDWDGGFGAFCGVLRPGPEVIPKYLAYFVSTRPVRDRWAGLAAGTNINNLKRKDLEQTPIPLPPLDEQQRIVAAMEEQFSRLDAAEASLERVRRGVARHWYATQLAAMTGPWQARPLGDLLISLKNGVFVSRPAAEPPGIRIFRISAVRPMSLDVEDVRYAPPGTDPEGAYIVEEDDLLFTRYSGNASYVGACARVPALAHPTLHPDKLIRAVVDRAVAEPAYLELALSYGPSAREIAQRRKTTAGQVGIAGSQLKSVPVATPPLDVQRQIVTGLEGPRSIWMALRRDLVRVLAQGQQLRAAVLRDAFAGRLSSPTVRYLPRK